MKSKCAFSPFLVCLLTVGSLLALPTSSPAGLNLRLDILRNSQSGIYTCDPIVTLTGDGGDSTPITYHEVYSPNTNFTGGVGAGFSENRDDHPDYNEFLQALTNGVWKLVMNVGDPSEHTYTFTVSAPGLVTNPFVDAVVDYPSDGTNNIPPLPDFEWHGPTNADSLSIYVANGNFSIFQPDNPGVSVTNETLPLALPGGDYLFHIGYQKDLSGLVSISTPLDGVSAPAPGWSSSEVIDLGNQSAFTVFAPAISTNAGIHTLMAHYAFDNPANLGQDSSGNHNDVVDPGSTWGPNVDAPTSTAVTGGGAAQFFSESSMTPEGQSFVNWTNTLSGSFSVSVWLNTANVVGNDNDSLDDNTGQSMIYADNNGLGATPVALTGRKVAFLTANPGGPPDTLHSSQTVTGLGYVHVVSTRDVATGQKKIYINGLLDNSDFASAEILPGDAYASIGGELSSPYSGLLDDVQIYSGILTDDEVLQLYNEPGTTIPDSLYPMPPATILAQYSFDNAADSLHDDTGNGYNLNLSASGPNYSRSTDAVAGGGAAFFNNPTGGSAGHIGYSTTPDAILEALADSYSISLWLKTTQVFEDDGGAAFEGGGIVWADVGGQANDSTPMGLTGSKLAFTTGGDGDDTLHSTNDINTGEYVQVVVTRNRVSGVKQIYVNGALDSTGLGSTNLLNDSPDIVFGANIIDNRGFDGLLDDIQIYSGVLNPTQIAYMHANPGATAPPTTVLTVKLVNVAVGGPNLQFSFRSIPGYVHAVQYSDDLSPGSWHDFNTYDGDGTVINVSVPMDNPQQRFYRLNSLINEDGGGD